MITCSYCGHKNRPGLLFCEECGHTLIEGAIDATVPTKRLETSLGEFSARATWGSASVGKISSIVMRIRDVSEPMVLELKDRIVFGRAEPNSPRQPDVDLTAYGALEKGVSRVHASIERSDDVLTIIDMGSANGTNLNGQRLSPNQARVLRDGDEIPFDKLIAHLYFQI